MEEKETKEPAISAEEVAAMKSEEIAQALNDKDATIAELEAERDRYKGLYGYVSEQNDALTKKIDKVSTLLSVAIYDVINKK